IKLKMKLEELKVYQESMELGEKVWNLVIKWDNFSKDTMGKQLVKAADSIAANLSEGFGRYHFREKKNFGYYSRGSLYETKTWITKANHRGLIGDKDYNQYVGVINDIGVKLNNYIKATDKQLLLKEDEVEYSHKKED
ncbi:MAG: four helix bundle protein, partial [Bacteroidales bacterium]|nr:four helix bundle protein [Bacteroidales bacterium]